MKVNSREEAWRHAEKIFPTSYMKDERASANAGYPIYKSTSDSEEYRFAQIADLNCRLEVNDGTQTINIWIEEEEEVKGMTATVRSMVGEFEEYKIEGIVSVQYIANSLVLTYIKDGEVKTTEYSTSEVIVEIH